MIKIILIYTSRAWILCRQAVYHALSWFARRSSQSRTVARNGSIFLSRPLPGIQNERQTSSYETHSPLPSKSCVFKCVSVRRAAHVAAMPAASPPLPSQSQHPPLECVTLHVLSSVMWGGRSPARVLRLPQCWPVIPVKTANPRSHDPQQMLPASQRQMQ